ncbi:heterocycloanthracin/sonorensin family bacteriocin [Paenactinomyces guangxiensis]|uniref:Heterocycloanthracin/sonorensin family bacteriocin n=1 Tax=Paenactinomyces guangxiensis TaxID=1490290 RepID=A0A7W2A877_9BACL|nr:heterocycloanthracin/sonorensin family bacteriocin [Paenactinomyces guangxiensis]MBH8592562.1 heterocycloanthracin/sonorensin family bacteriocin [Paenactinomyces guangxiensis]
MNQFKKELQNLEYDEYTAEKATPWESQGQYDANVSLCGGFGFLCFFGCGFGFFCSCRCGCGFRCACRCSCRSACACR